MKKPSADVAQNGVNALDLIPSLPVGESTFTKAVAILQANFGTSYSPEKIATLFDLIDDDGWSEERFKRTFKWFIKNKPFPAWTVADWFAYSVKVYPYSWYLEQVAKNGREVNGQIDTYKLDDGTLVFRYRDSDELPFRKV